MSIPVCYKCHRPLRSAESIARGYGSECYRKTLDDMHAGLQSLRLLCFEMNTQAHCSAILPDVKIKMHNKEENVQLSLIEDLFEVTK